MFGLFTPRCPLGPRERVWVERGLGRLIDRVGLERLLQTKVLTHEDLADVWREEPISAADLAQRLGSQFPFPVDGIDWIEEPDISEQQTSHYVPGESPVGIVPQQPSQTPELRTAHVARILADHTLHTRGEFGPREEQPPLAMDLLCVLAGIGLFPANTTVFTKGWTEGLLSWSIQRAQPFMPSRLFGYALAVRCRLFEEEAPWAGQLRLDAREPFDAGTKFLRKNSPVVWDSSRDVMRSFREPPPVDDVQRALRSREAAVQINALFDVIQYELSDERVQHEIGHLVHDRCDDVREEAIRAIVLLDADSRELGEALTIFAGDTVPRVRSLAALALGEVRHPPDDAVQTLRELTGDAEPIVSSTAAESLLGFPEGLADDRPRVFRVLRQQLARCNYASVDRFMQRLDRSVADAGQLIELEFRGAEDETWRRLLLESLAGHNGSAMSEASAEGSEGSETH